MEFSICFLCVTQEARRVPMFSEDRKEFLSEFLNTKDKEASGACSVWAAEIPLYSVS